MKRSLSAERLREVLDYASGTGAFTWKVRLNNNGPEVGARAGSVNGKGYRLISVDGTQYREHRLAWLYVTGAWPAEGLDHKDGQHNNNAITNLREGSQGENLQNMARPKSNTSGLLGASFCCRTGRWMAQIVRDGSKTWLGRHDTAESAHEAYLKAKSNLHTFQPTPRPQPCALT